MSQGPPPKFKKALEQRVAIITSETASLEGLDAPSAPPRRDPQGLSKIARLGIPPAPASDFPLPPYAILGGTPGSRIKALVLSIWRPSFLAILRSTNFFDIRGETTIVLEDDKRSQSIHIGENYAYHAIGTDSYTNIPVAPHAWIILSNFSVWQWHYVHPACECEGPPTFLQSLENYLMYMHLRVGEPLPLSIFDADENLHGWGSKTYRD